MASGEPGGLLIKLDTHRQGSEKWLHRLKKQVESESVKKAKRAIQEKLSLETKGQPSPLQNYLAITSNC